MHEGVLSVCLYAYSLFLFSLRGFINFSTFSFIGNQNFKFEQLERFGLQIFKKIVLYKCLIKQTFETLFPNINLNIWGPGCGFSQPSVFADNGYACSKCQ